MSNSLRTVSIGLSLAVVLLAVSTASALHIGPALHGPQLHWASGGVVSNNILLENGDVLLLESGDKILLE